MAERVDPYDCTACENYRPPFIARDRQPCRATQAESINAARALCGGAKFKAARAGSEAHG